MIFLAVLFVLSLILGAPREAGLDSSLRPIVTDHVFSIAGWEVRTLTRETLPSFFSRRPAAGDAGSVLEYFETAEQARGLEYTLKRTNAGARGDDATLEASIEAELQSLLDRQHSLESIAERVLEDQIRTVASAQGIYNPLMGMRVSFPPVDFKLTRPPQLLVVSPWDRIESINETMLQPETTLRDAEDIETRVDGLNVSSLVTGIGGLGATYPTFVSNEMGLRSTINAAAEEWLHQYLAFRPLGFLYVLDLTGAAPNYQIACMNETLAGMVSKEIGGLVYEKYYAELIPEVRSQKSEVSAEKPASSFDFNLEMREIRKTVDLYLSQGEIEKAETFMNERRDYLAENGYYIRKLNQAYFAFYGAYTDSPTSIDPIGAEMKTVRSASASLKEFLDRVSSMSSRQALRDAAGHIEQ